LENNIDIPDIMRSFKRYSFILCCVSIIIIVSGCALLEIPGKIIEGTFSLIGKLLGIIEKVPKPPPGVF